MKRSKFGTLATLALTFTVSGFTVVPVLAAGFGEPSPTPSTCAGDPGPVAEDGTPAILGPSPLTVADLRRWWASTRRGQPRRLTVDVADVIALYISEGTAEGVRGDLALAQAIHETGYFTNSDTSRNNFAGIVHYDGTASGKAFPNALLGVRAQIQLLKKYAAGNSASLANPNVAPRAGASASTWGQLAGRWATDTRYWNSIRTLHEAMSAQAARPSVSSVGQASTSDTVEPAAANATPGCSAGPAVVGDYALPVDRRWYDEHPDWFTRPHHDYPAIDIPVPTGTPLYAMTNGVVVGTPTSGKCGVGVIFDGDDHARYTYCHGRPGSQAVEIGDRVSAGQRILDSASTGNSTGPHLHLGVEVGGTRRCPQALLTAVVLQQRKLPTELSPTGCRY